MEICFDCYRAFPLVCLKAAELISGASERVFSLLWHYKYCFTCHMLEFDFKSLLAHGQIFASSLKTGTLGTSYLNDNNQTIYKYI